ncbi:EI24 domain-containing protein [Uliginosibacterium aquaticum]|uniref:EI24 domain-containing protein n=1 Tax=Uliginosibacterium aquaticum TaxID=2731212 RepID=A0ABX2IFJ7_9RHOO|nr:EI24 domain-containing protein [Uliginosibacterium aquaticum]NSL55443.1 EI24 domain-containing protein [Uliginosibacterium aquaticum]
MQRILLAAGRALRSLAEPGMLWHLLWPTLVALLLWGGLAIGYWSEAAQALLQLMRGWPLVGGWFGNGHEIASGLLSFALQVVMLLLMLPLVYVTAAMLVSVFAIGFMLERVAARDYRELEQRRGGSLIGSVTNSAGAFVIFLLVALATLPLWFVPGLGLLLSLTLGAWLNKQCYAYDALMNHADETELARLPRERRNEMWLLALGCGLLGFVPLLNLLAPAFTGLCCVHYLLEALRQERGRPIKDISAE